MSVEAVQQSCPLCGNEEVRAWDGGMFVGKTKYTCDTCQRFVIDHGNVESEVRQSIGTPFNEDLSRRAAETWNPDASDDDKRILYVLRRDGRHRGEIAGEVRPNRDFPW